MKRQEFLDMLSDEKYYIHSTIIELIARGYARKYAKDMLKRSKLTKWVFDDEMKWTCFHDMDTKEWADWIEIENGLKKPFIPLWKQKYVAGEV